MEENWRSHGFHTDERLGWMLEDRARTMPDRIAVITPTRQLTYHELQRRASAVARTLVANGVRNGDPVCWMLPTDAEAVSVASAIWRIGAVSSPIVPIYGAREIAAVVEQSRPVAVITNGMVRGRRLPEEFDAVLATLGHEPRVRLLAAGEHPGWLDADAEGPGALPATVLPAPADSPALILYTSGTEAAPKGAVHSTTGLMHELRSCVTEWGITFRDRMFMASPMTHITGLLQGFLIPTRVGGAAILMDRWNAAEAVELIEQHAGTYMAGATPFLRELLAAYAASGRTTSSLRQYCCGGAAVPAELIREADRLGIAAYRAWGMTELPTSTLANELDPLWARAETDGRLAPGVEMRVVDDDGRDVEPGREGGLLLRGPEMMLGYVRVDEGAPAAISEDGWFATGDVGYLGDDGYVRISGRTKDIINRGGEKFSVREIEDHLRAHPGVEAVAVLALPGGRLGERIGAVIVSDEDVTPTALADFMTSRGVAKQKTPELVVVVEAIPMNATGKVDKRAILALFDGR
ncbi:acyl-CoA synthetase (AMP-forming)/AMP-acid ligase II [Microbacterium trichothecenolyticum]|uniref:class I adenylate-forming enzyme family protein n=1 Tax=Microbacterium trichothecenolyticum TaxID=69370 RepID=UPI002856A499|nr:AMP-binding protein [Microbacterium trichothecenolyticum]MDR7112243.1 acyl-CoA synthetase (AMP-forming)/AMP-acid ligase II [Microbacterium trichothecenolyticum]